MQSHRVTKQQCRVVTWWDITPSVTTLHYIPLPSILFTSLYLSSVLSPIHPTMGWKLKINITALSLNGAEPSSSATYTHRHQLLQQSSSLSYLNLSSHFFSSLHCPALFCFAYFALLCTILFCSALHCTALNCSDLLTSLFLLSGWIERYAFSQDLILRFLVCFILLQYLSVCLLSNYILRGFYATARGMGETVGRAGSMKERGVAWNVIDRIGGGGRIGRLG